MRNVDLKDGVTGDRPQQYTLSSVACCVSALMARCIPRDGASGSAYALLDAWLWRRGNVMVKIAP